MSLLYWVSDGLKKRVFKFIIKKVLGRFIDEPDLSQLDVQISKGQYNLSNVSLNIQRINEHLRDLPFVLKSGYIEQIKIRIPFNILSENMHIEVNGVELSFKLKESMNDVSRNVLSSFLTESFIGEHGDPNVLASSILVGDVRKSDLEEELDEEDFSTDTSQSNAAESMIAQFIEKIVSSLKATVTAVTFKFEFPSEMNPKKSNVLLLHFPRLEYADNTSFPTSGSRWHPSEFVYSFLFNGFFVQLFDEHIVEEKQFESTSSSSSTHFEQQADKLLDDGNTVIYGRTEDNKIQIKIVPADNKRKREDDSPSASSRIEIQFNVSSIHSVFTPSQLKMLLEIMESLSKTLSTSGHNEFIISENDAKVQSAIPQEMLEINKESIVDDVMEQSMHETMYYSFESTVKAEQLTPTKIGALLQENHLGNNSEMFNSVYSDTTNRHFEDDHCKSANEFNSDDLFHSIQSTNEEETYQTQEPNVPNVQPIHFRANSDDFSTLESPPVSLQITARLQGATFNVLYEDTNLKNMWKRFRSSTKLSHGEGPAVTVNHLALRCTNLVIQSENNNDVNKIKIAIGTISIYERLRKKKIQDLVQNEQKASSLSQNIVEDYISSKPKPHVVTEATNEFEFDEQKILEFLPKNNLQDNTRSPQIGIIIDFNRFKNEMDFRARMDPLKLSLEAGIMERLVSLIKDIRKSFKERKSAVVKKTSDDVDLMNDFISEEQTVFTAEYKLDMDSVLVEISFPEREGKKHSYSNNLICFELSNIECNWGKKKQGSEWKWEKTKLGSDEFVLNSKIDKLAMFLLDLKSKSKPQPILIIPSPFELGLTSRKKRQNSGLRFGVDSFFSYNGNEDKIDSEIDLDTTSSASNLSDEQEASDEQYETEEATTPVEMMDAIFSYQKAFNRANLALSVTSSKVEIGLTREDFILLQNLIQFLMKEVTEPLDKLTKLIQDMEEKDSINIKERPPMIPISNKRISDTDINDLNPETAIKFNVVQLVIEMKQQSNIQEIPSDSCLLIIKDLVTFAMMYPESQLRLNIGVQDLSLNHNIFDDKSKKNLKLEIIKNSKRQTQEYRKNNAALLLNLVMRQPAPKKQKITLQLQTNGIYMNHYFYQEKKSWQILILDFFKSDEVYDGEFIVSLNITLQDTVVSYSPVKLATRLLVSIGDIKCLADIRQSAPKMIFSTQIKDIYCLLHNSFKKDIFTDLKGDSPSKLGFINDIKKLGFAQIFYMNNLETEVEIPSEKEKVAKEKTHISVKVSNGTAILDFCSDSMDTLINLATYLGSNGDLMEDTNKLEKKDNKTDSANNFTAQIHHPNFMAQIDENAFKPDNKRTKASLYPILDENSMRKVDDNIAQNLSLGYFDTEMYMSRRSNTCMKKASLRGELEAEESVKIFKNFNTEHIQDYFSLLNPGSNMLESTLLPSYPRPQLEILLYKDVNIVINLYSGKDWKEDGNSKGSAKNESEEVSHPPGIRNLDNSVQVNLMDWYIHFYSFDPCTEYLYKVKLSIGNVDILDKIRTSNRKKILCYWNRPQFPREDLSRMVEVMLECVQPSPHRQELRLEVYLLPIRINLHQRTLYFLLKFFGIDPMTAQVPSSDEQIEPERKHSKEEQQSPRERIKHSDKANQESEIYLQYFKMSQLDVVIDYEPIEVDYKSLKQGSKLEFINFIPLNGAEIHLSALDLRGVHGIESLVARVTEAWMPDLYGTKTFRFLLGILPVRSIYNVGSGVADLFLLPIQQYQKDGQLFRGISKGIASFVRHTSVESVSLGAATASGVSHLFETINKYISGSNMQSVSSSRESGAPSANFSGGLQRAYNDINSSYENAKFAILAIPREENVVVGTLRTFPRLLFIPLVGVTSAASNILSAIEANLRPKEEKEDLFKRPSS